jgi:SAM-dependent methyltransferase
MDLDDVRREWDAEADAFDVEADHGLLDPVTRAAWWALLENVLPAAPARVADLGCGTGSVAVLLAEHGYDVTGLDLSPRMLERARAKAASAGTSCTFAVGDASSPALAAAAYDVVLSRHVVWALPDPAAALRRWVDLLAPGGRLVLVEGLWTTGAGIRADALRALVEPLELDVVVTPLTDPALWGKEIQDERFALVGIRSRHR